jgi:putative integral membrane protein (TIGR02587 family)
MSVFAELREQGRGVAGALLVLGVSFAYTIEVWHLAVEISTVHLVGFVVVGLALVVPVTRAVGFREGDGEGPGTPDRSPVWVEFAEVVFQGLFAGYGMLLLLGVLDLRLPVSTVVRAGLVQVVPLAFGAALANELLSGEQDEIPEASFPRSLGVFATGAVFLAAPIAPTEEVGVLALEAGWLRLGAVLLVSLLMTYLVLYELEFRGQSARLNDGSWWWQLGQACMVYAVGLAVAVGLLLAIGDVNGDPFPIWVQKSIVLGFPAAVGTSAARVVVG